MAIKQLLRIDTRATDVHSVTRSLGDETVSRLITENPGVALKQRDLSNGIPFLNEAWINASLEPFEDRSAEQHAVLAESDELIDELVRADILVMTVPMYNFSLPAVTKAWIDQICRPGRTFNYSENGPLGLLKDRPVYLVVASGGVAMGSEVDFLSAYLKQVFHFIGISDIRLIAAEHTAQDVDASISAARATLNQWLPGEIDAVALRETA